MRARQAFAAAVLAVTPMAAMIETGCGWTDPVRPAGMDGFDICPAEPEVPLASLEQPLRPFPSQSLEDWVGSTITQLLRDARLAEASGAPVPDELSSTLERASEVVVEPEDLVCYHEGGSGRLLLNETGTALQEFVVENAVPPALPDSRSLPENS